MDTILCKGARFTTGPDPDDDKAFTTAAHIHEDVSAFYLTGSEERAVYKAANGIELNSNEMLIIKRLNNQFGHLVP